MIFGILASFVLWPFFYAAIAYYDINNVLKEARAMNPKALILPPLPGYGYRALLKKCLRFKKIGPLRSYYYVWREPASWEVYQR